MRLTGFEVSVEDFMLYCTSKNLSKKTLQSYEQTLRLFGIYLKEKFDVDNVQKVTKTHIRQYIKSLMDRGKYTVHIGMVNNNPAVRKDYGKKISSTTINNYLRNIKVFSIG